MSHFIFPYPIFSPLMAHSMGFPRLLGARLEISVSKEKACVALTPPFLMYFAHQLCKSLSLLPADVQQGIRGQHCSLSVSGMVAHMTVRGRSRLHQFSGMAYDYWKLFKE